jgi:hypothetical protein
VDYKLITNWWWMNFINYGWKWMKINRDDVSDDANGVMLVDDGIHDLTSSFSNKFHELPWVSIMEFLNTFTMALDKCLVGFNVHSFTSYPCQ